MATLAEEFQRSWLTSLIGIVIFLVGASLLTWNEGRAVHHLHSLDEVYNNGITLNPYEKLRPEFDGRVVHITGDLTINEPLTEPDYGISIQAVKLKRRVQMYQWVEERSPRDDDDIISNQKSVDDYYYVTEWRDRLIDSSNFYIRYGHQNPTEMPLQSVVYRSTQVKVGQLELGSEITEKFNDFVEVSSDERPEQKDVKLHMGIYYHCQDIWNPEVGDIRVQFYYAGMDGEPVSIVAKQENGKLVPYKTTKGHDIALLRHGNLNINQIFSAEHSDARIETWKLRLYGCLLLYFSSICLAKLLKILFSKIPYFENLLSGEAGDMHNCLVAFSISLLIMSFAWMLYRPMIAVALIFAAVSPFMHLVMGIYNDGPADFVARN